LGQHPGSNTRFSGSVSSARRNAKVPQLYRTEGHPMTASSSTAKPPLVDRSLSKGTLDGRTLVARRRRELIAVYTAALGGAESLSEGQRIDIRKAAELTALAEQARARAMREGITGAGDLADMVKLENAAARAVKALGIKAATTANRIVPLRERLRGGTG
jgi:hypothetical protein